jgi:hypothetical protein
MDLQGDNAFPMRFELVYIHFTISKGEIQQEIARRMPLQCAGAGRKVSGPDQVFPPQAYMPLLSTSGRNSAVGLDHPSFLSTLSSVIRAVAVDPSFEAVEVPTFDYRVGRLR